MSKGFILFFVGIVALLLQGCKPQVPSEYIQPDDMEDILYDYHIAQSMANMKANDVDRIAYQDAVLKKHGVSRDEFDKSLRYYMRNTTRMHDIYENLSQRLENEANAQGASVSDINRFGENATSGDTANIWNQARSLVILSAEPMNLKTFHIVADSSFHKGDSFILDFKAQNLIQSGSRNVMVVMSVKFNNDSIVTRQCFASMDGTLSISIDDTQRLGVKEIRGYFVMPKEQMVENAQNLKIFVAQDIRLVKMHTKPPQTQNSNVGGADSTATDSANRSGMTGPAPVPTTPVPSSKPY